MNKTYLEPRKTNSPLFFVKNSFRLGLFVAMLMLCFTGNLFSQSVNINAINNGLTFTMPGPGAGTRPCGTQMYDNGGALAYIGDNTDFWICVCAPAGQYTSYTFNYSMNDPAGNSNDDYIYVYEGCGTGGPVLINQLTGAGAVTITATAPGVCLTIRVQENGTYAAPGGVFGVAGTMNCIPPPGNDDSPCGAFPLNVNASCMYTTYDNNLTSLSPEQPEPGCGSFANNDVWFSATVPPNGQLTIQALDAAGGLALFPCMAAYTGTCIPVPCSCGPLTHIGCAETQSAVVPSVLNLTQPPGTIVYIRVWDYLEREGFFNLCAMSTTNPTGEIFEGNNTATCGTPMTFYDPGGTGNYFDNNSASYKICPSIPGQYVTVSFASFNLQSTFDWMTVIDGGGTCDPIIGNYTGASNPGVITSSNADGCLIFGFRSDALTVSTGWVATVNCTSTPGVNTPICSITNCSGECGTWVCADGLYPTENPGPSLVQELNEQSGGCQGHMFELATAWFYFTALTAGNLGIVFNGPNGQNYDFAIYGPTTNGEPPCPLNTGESPIRCSFADQNQNPTGLANGAGDYYEGVEGDLFVEDLDVLPGETYTLCMNINQNGGPQPIIDMTFTGTGTLDCTPLPINLLSFEGDHSQGYNRIRWVSATEYNNNYYTLYYSEDAVNWEVINTQNGAGNSNIAIGYAFSHISPYNITYYKLRQTDYDGAFKEYGPISISKMGSAEEFTFNYYPNPSDNFINLYTDYDGGGNLTVELVDNLGRVVQTQILPGPGMHMLDITPLVSGLYILQVSSTKGIERLEKIIIR